MLLEEDERSCLRLKINFRKIRNKAYSIRLQQEIDKKRGS